MMPCFILAILTMIILFINMGIPDKIGHYFAILFMIVVFILMINEILPPHEHVS